MEREVAMLLRKIINTWIYSQPVFVWMPWITLLWDNVTCPVMTRRQMSMWASFYLSSKKDRIYLKLKFAHAWRLLTREGHVCSCRRFPDWQHFDRNLIVYSVGDEAGNNSKHVRKFSCHVGTGKMSFEKSKQCDSCLGVLSQSSVPDPSCNSRMLGGVLCT